MSCGCYDRRDALRPKVLDALRRAGILVDSPPAAELQQLTFREVAESFTVEQQKKMEALVAQWQKHHHKLRVSASMFFPRPLHFMGL